MVGEITMEVVLEKIEAVRLIDGCVRLIRRRQSDGSVFWAEVRPEGALEMARALMGTFNRPCHWHDPRRSYPFPTQEERVGNALTWGEGDEEHGVLPADRVEVKEEVEFGVEVNEHPNYRPLREVLADLGIEVPPAA